MLFQWGFPTDRIICRKRPDVALQPLPSFPQRSHIYHLATVLRRDAVSARSSESLTVKDTRDVGKFGKQTRKGGIVYFPRNEAEQAE